MLVYFVYVLRWLILFMLFVVLYKTTYINFNSYFKAIY